MRGGGVGWTEHYASVLSIGGHFDMWIGHNDWMAFAFDCPGLDFRHM